MEVSPDELKKVTCKGLVGVLKASPLAEQIDPKAFYLMLNQSFPVLQREDGIDLGPVYTALRQNADPEDLDPLFIRFERKGRDLGVSMFLPPELAALSEAERAERLELYEATARAAPEDVEPSTTSMDVMTASMGDVEKRVLNTLVQSFKGSPVGDRVDASQLNYFIGGRLHQVFDGKTVNVQQIVDAFRQTGADDQDIYVGIAFAQERLSTLDITVIEPPMNVQPALKATLVKRAKDAARETPRRAPVPAESNKGREERAKLEDLGLGAEKVDIQKRRAIRIGVLATVAVVGGGLGYLFRPTRPLGRELYADSVPLAQAELVEGTLYGTLDAAKWNAFDPKDKEARLLRFEETLKAEGRMRGLQIRLPTGDLVIAAPEGKRLRPAVAIMR